MRKELQTNLSDEHAEDPGDPDGVVLELVVEFDVVVVEVFEEREIGL